MRENNWMISEDFRRLQKTSEDFRRPQKTSEDLYIVNNINLLKVQTLL